jgi:hypothetical protein
MLHKVNVHQLYRASLSRLLIFRQFITMIITIIISFMQGIYNYIPETNHVRREYTVTGIL